jgi:hypothetical protein
MAEDLAVWFYRVNKGEAEQWAWFRAPQAPVVGDFVITPAGSRWMVVARTWVEGNRCNVTVRDVPPGRDLMDVTDDGRKADHG